LWNLLIYSILSHLVILICQILITEIFNGGWRKKLRICDIRNFFPRSSTNRLYHRGTGIFP
jgi:hypothetical protein